MVFTGVALLIYSQHLLSLFKNSLDSELYSHITLIPIVSAYILYSNRRKILTQISYSYLPGIILVALGIILNLIGAGYHAEMSKNDFLSLMTFSALIFWIGSFVFCYGTAAFKRGSFPLLFLFFMVPVPGLIMDNLIYMLQAGSTEVTAIILSLTGVPVLREGFVFHFPGLNVEVAKECSGIRSSLALFITSIIAGQLYLQTGSRRVILCLLAIPITIFKNGVRIVSLSLLGYYVDERMLEGSLHTRGGIPFFLLALSVLGIVLWILKRTEKNQIAKKSVA